MSHTSNDAPLVNPALLEIIVCPDCHGTLALTGAELVCQTCGLAYPIKDQIPVLLVDEARRPG
ncbi:MAG: Trm112 family protein [Nocardioides sp.]